MYKVILFVFLFLSTIVVVAQVPCNFQNQKQYLSGLKPDKEYENVLSTTLCSDSLSSSFVIWVKKSVKKHRHEYHSENLFVLEGEATMTMGKETFSIKSGDYVFIPKDTWHSVEVKSVTPLKVLSIQSPFFDGKDRVFEE